jgi:hypothetical protein
MQSLKPWCSSEDIAKGARGGHEIAQKLGQVNFGIVCLTPSNLHNEWIHFESGALSKNLDNSALYTLLLDLQPTDVKPPLGHFQHTRTSRDEIFKLVQAINGKTENPLTAEILRASFDAFWPELDTTLRKLPNDSSQAPIARSDREILEEILSVVRGQGLDNEKDKRAERQFGKTVLLIGFAEGVIKARGVEGKVVGGLNGENAVLALTLQGTEYELAVPIEDLATSKKLINDYIFANTITDDDIPF